jgi:hypothetical protein
MKPWERWLYLVAGLAALVVAAAAIAQAIRQGSWGPVESVAWLPAVIAASWPGSGRGCLRRRRTQAG